MAGDVGSVHAELKTKQRTIRDAFPPDLGLRARRTISWIGRTEAALQYFALQKAGTRRHHTLRSWHATSIYAS